MITDFHRRGARPAQRTFTPSSCISSRRRRITSRLKPIRNFTSSGERLQFSVEKAYAEIAFTPISIAPSTTSNSELSPCSCPLVRASPRSLAQRPLPSITIATCSGTRCFGIAGGVAPDGCGVVPRVREPLSSLDVLHRPQLPLEVPGEERRDEAAGLAEVAGVGGGERRPVTGQQGAEHLDRLRGRGGGARAPGR